MACVGEGAGVLVLERLPDARRRGAEYMPRLLANLDL